MPPTPLPFSAPPACPLQLLGTFCSPKLSEALLDCYLGEQPVSRPAKVRGQCCVGSRGAGTGCGVGTRAGLTTRGMGRVPARAATDSGGPCSPAFTTPSWRLCPAGCCACRPEAAPGAARWWRKPAGGLSRHAGGKSVWHGKSLRRRRRECAWGGIGLNAARLRAALQGHVYQRHCVLWRLV